MRTTALGRPRLDFSFTGLAFYEAYRSEVKEIGEWGSGPQENPSPNGRGLGEGFKIDSHLQIVREVLFVPLTQPSPVGRGIFLSASITQTPRTSAPQMYLCI